MPSVQHAWDSLWDYLVDAGAWYDVGQGTGRIRAGRTP